jgi:transposase
MRYRAHERAALMQAGVRAFVLVAGNLSGQDMAEVFVTDLPAMQRCMVRHQPPCIARVTREGAVSLLVRCWAHLVRDIDAMIGRGGGSQDIGDALRRHVYQMFHRWHRVRDGTLKRSSFRNSMTPVRREVERLLEAGSTCGVPKTEGVCRDILKRRQALWTFVYLDGVEPTNNAAERAIRPGVLWRKGSFGTQSAPGSRFVEAMMTMVTTLKQQHRHPLTYLTTACEAALRGEAAPSLLPADDSA